MTGSSFKPDDGKCLHYHFYFIDEELGLCSVRLPTWCPIPACSSTAMGTVIWLGKWTSGGSTIEFWTMPFVKKQSDLQAIYERLTRAAIHTVKPDNIATFLGRKLNGNYQDEMGNRFNTRIEGTRIKHSMGPVSIKMYDKFRLILRIETTVLNVSFFKHYREVEHKDGTRTMAWAEMRKTIYSLAPLRELLLAALGVQEHRPGLTVNETASNTRPHQENLTALGKQIVALRPQAQTPLHHSPTLHGSCRLKVLPDLAKIY
jgi:hypothetical protein